MLREANKVKTVVGNTQFTLTAPSGKSYRIRDIHVNSPSGQYATLTVDRTVVGYYRVGGGTLGNHLPFKIADEENVTLYRFCVENLGFGQIPIATGETFSITGVHDSDSIVTVEYDEYDAGDVRNTEPNGSNATRFQFINYGRYSTTLAAGDNRYQTQQTTSQYPAFPYGEVVPSKMTMKLLGILASDVNKYSASNNRFKTTFLKLIRNRKTLFDDDMNGLPLYGYGTFVSNVTTVASGYSVPGNYDDVDRRLPFIPEKPLEFKEGESLDLYVTTTEVTGSANIAAADAEVGLIFDVTMQP